MEIWQDCVVEIVHFSVAKPYMYVISGGYTTNKVITNNTMDKHMMGPPSSNKPQNFRFSVFENELFMVAKKTWFSVVRTMMWFFGIPLQAQYGCEHTCEYWGQGCSRTHPSPFRIPVPCSCLFHCRQRCSPKTLDRSNYRRSVKRTIAGDSAKGELRELKTYKNVDTTEFIDCRRDELVLHLFLPQVSKDH